MQTEITLEIPYYDADSMGVVWHGNYAKYFEVARCDFLSTYGYDYVAMERSGYVWPVIDMRIKYVKPLYFQQKIRIQTSLAEWEYRLKLKYLITDAETNERLCKAYTSQVAVDLKTKKLCFQSPEAMIRSLGINKSES